MKPVCFDEYYLKTIYKTIDKIVLGVSLFSESLSHSVENAEGFIRHDVSLFTLHTEKIVASIDLYSRIQYLINLRRD